MNYKLLLTLFLTGFTLLFLFQELALSENINREKEK